MSRKHPPSAHKQEIKQRIAAGPPKIIRESVSIIPCSCRVVDGRQICDSCIYTSEIKCVECGQWSANVSCKLTNDKIIELHEECYRRLLARQ